MMYQMNQVLEGIKVKGRCVDVKQHRHFAFYDIVLDPGSSIKKLKNRVEDIALGIKSKTIPIVKSIPEKGVVRLQVATKNAETLHLDEMYDSICSWGKGSIPDMTFPLLLGETNQGENLWIDMKDNPHLLIAGGTGSGKSVLVHNLIANAVLLHAIGHTNTVTYLVDPKRVEFSCYNNVDLKNTIGGVFYDYTETVKLLQILVTTMESRYRQMERLGFKSIEEKRNLFPSILLIIDEVSDLMMQDKGCGLLQNLIVCLAQKARASGIYLVLATQRPSTDVLTGLLKANFPGRIACKTASGVDSKVVLDMTGAENLLGRGDALIKNMVHDLVRFQVAYTEPYKIIKLFSKYYDRRKNYK